jgi:hypothetical protein
MIGAALLLVALHLIALLRGCEISHRIVKVGENEAAVDSPELRSGPESRGHPRGLGGLDLEPQLGVGRRAAVRESDECNLRNRAPDHCDFRHKTGDCGKRRERSDVARKPRGPASSQLLGKACPRGEQRTLRRAEQAKAIS